MKLYDYDVIGYKIISPFHLATLLAYASRLEPKRKPLKVLIMVSKGPWQTKILSESATASSKLKLTYIEQDAFDQQESAIWPVLLFFKPIALLASHLTGQRRVLVCSPTITCVRFSASSIRNAFLFKPIVIDEGIGSFNRFYIFRQEADQMVSCRILAAALAIFFQFIWLNLPLFGGSRVTLFSFRDGKPQLNRPVAQSYKETFTTGYIERNEPVYLEPNTIIILTHPFAETGVCTEAEMVDQITAWVNYARSLGARPVLKAHPAESASKYDSAGLERINYTGPVEELFAAASENIREVWGFNSTSLITGRALFGLETKRMDLPWRHDSLQRFQGQALALFLTYTDPISLRKKLNPDREKSNS